MISFVLPTWNRPERLSATLDALAGLPAGDREVIIVDNDSDARPAVPSRLDNGWSVHLIELDENLGAASRNRGVKAAQGDWIIMLDDDSHPRSGAFAEVIAEAPDDVMAIGGDIVLPSGTREAGGLPEVIIGCGAAIRRDAFLAVGGYDETFHYYAEEYDLCAKFILAGGRIIHDARFGIMHEKSTTNRDMDVILQRLVRNNGWIAHRYAPTHLKSELFEVVLTRYRDIADNEHARAGYDRGVSELNASLSQQPVRTMPTALFDRFTGLESARRALSQEPGVAAAMRVAIIEPGKHAWVVQQALDEFGVERVEDPSQADALIIGTLSPGPLMDAWDRRAQWGKPVVRCWSPYGERQPAMRMRA